MISLLAYNPLCETTADVRVRVRRRIVQVQVEQPIKGAVVPVAAIEAMPVPELTGISR